MSSFRRDIFILSTLQIVLGSVCLYSVPRIFVDEAWDSALGYNLARKGTLNHPFIEGFGGMQIHFVQNRVILPLVCAAVFKVADYSIVTSRIGSLLFGLLAVISLYAVMRRWFGEKQAICIGLATIIHPWFFEISRRARPEIYYIALSLVFLWLIVSYFDSGSRPTAFFCGAVAGLSALAHPNGLILIFSISLAVVFWLRIRNIGRLVVWAGFGSALVILPYIIYVLWAVQDPQVSFTEQMQIGMLFKLPLYNEIFRWKRFLKLPEGVALALIMVVSWSAAWHRSSAADKTIATIIVLFALILPFVSVNANARYLAVLIPFFSSLMIRLVWRTMIGDGVARLNRYKCRFAIGIGTVVLYLLMCIVPIALMFYHLRCADFNKVTDRIASIVGPNRRVFGNPIFWFGHNRYKYGPYPITHEYIHAWQVIDMVRRHRFDFAVRTAWSSSPPMGFAQPPRSMPDFRDNCLCDVICRIYGTKIDGFFDPYYGPIEIYKLNWDKSF